MLCWFLLLATVLGISFGEDDVVFEGDFTKTGAVFSVHASNSGAFVITLLPNDKYYVYWGNKDVSETVQCVIDKTVLPLNVLFLDAWTNEDTLYILNSVNSQVYLHSFWITLGNGTTTCDVLQQANYVPAGKVLYGFLLPRGEDLLMSLVDSKRDWYYALLPPSIPSKATPARWTQSRSLIDVDTSAGDTTGSPNKAVPSHHYAAAQDKVVFLDKTGKVYTSDIKAVMKNSTAEEFVSLVFAPSSNITAVGSLLVEETLSFGSVHLVDPNCTSDLVVFDYTSSVNVGLNQTILYSTGEDGGRCSVLKVASDKTSIYYQHLQEVFKLNNKLVSSTFFSAPEGVGILDFKVSSQGVMLMIARNSTGTIVYRITPTVGNATVETFEKVPFTYGSVLRWQLVEDASGDIIGALFYVKNGFVYGYGFEDPTPLQIVVARVAARDFIDINLAAIGSDMTAPNRTATILGFNDGDGENLELIRVVHWDYTSLVLPLPDTSPPEGTSFVFEDFIMALTRVKNEAYAAFEQDTISYVSPWTPSNWTEADGLQLDISFDDGVKLAKTETILQGIADELEVLIERECEYRDFLVCDSIDITMSYSVIKSRKRVIAESVVFRVVGSGALFVPSLIVTVVSILFLAVV